MENESANTNSEVNNSKIKKSTNSNSNRNEDIRTFFEKVTGPTSITTNKKIIKVITLFYQN